MSKLPPQSLWSRAASKPAPRLRTARAAHHAAAGRHAGAASVAAFQQGGSAGQQQLLPSDVPDVPGAVLAPYCGPQPLAVVEAWERGQLVVSSSSQSSAASGSNVASSSGSGSNSAAVQLHISSRAAATLLAPIPMRRYFSTSFAAASHSGISTNNGAAPVPPPSAANGKRAARSGDASSGGFLEPAPLVGRPGTMDALHIRLAELATSSSRSSHKSSGGAGGSGWSYGGSTAMNAARLTAALPPEVATVIGQDVMAAPSSGSTSNASSPSLTPPASPGPQQALQARSESLPSSSTQPPSGRATLDALAANAAVSTSPPPGVSAPVSSDAPLTLPSDWEGQFRAPRSQRHAYTFEHGAFGIPKRHPLSSVRTRRPSSEPPAAPAPRSRLAQAADFLTGAAPAPQGPGPIDGEEARRAALSGGSTAEGKEAFLSTADVEADVAQPADGKEMLLRKSRIRDASGQIVRERLRSVQVGEDAYFLRPDSLGVADGVGGWASRPGADPALFSRLLMHFCAVELSRYDQLSAAELDANDGSLLAAWSAVDPVEVMHHAWERCVRASRREGILGSSTALIALLRGDELRIANVGDCVLLIIRAGDLLFRSEEQQHSFNFPVQLGMMGETAASMDRRRREGKKNAAREGAVGTSDEEDYDELESVPRRARPEPARAGLDVGSAGAAAAEGEEDVGEDWDEPRRDAGRYTVKVQRGDIIVVGSDGLMDNLFDEDILEEVLRFAPWPPRSNNASPDAAGASSSQSRAQHAPEPLPSDFSPQLVSEALCSRAKAVSEDSRAVSSPFQQRAVEEGLHYVGGKHDDISVLVAVIGERRGEADVPVPSLTSATATARA